MHARAGAGNGLDVVDALGRLQNGVDQDRLREPVLGFELGQKLIEIVDVPRPLDLGQHDDVELGAGGRHDLQDVVERPGRIEGVDARPQAGGAVIVRVGHLDEAAPRRDLGVGGNGVLEVAQHHVDLGDQIAEPSADLLVVRRDEMDHALQPHRQLAVGFGGADGKGAKCLAGVRVADMGWLSLRCSRAL